MKTEFGVFGSHPLILQTAHYIYINMIKHMAERLTSFLSVVYNLKSDMSLVQ